MCGRFVLSRPEDVEEEFDIDESRITKPEKRMKRRYDIRPRSKILAITIEEEKKILSEYVWWLTHRNLAKDKHFKFPTFNARSETIFEKWSFKHSIVKRRCVIPADGFYEWIGEKGKKKRTFIKFRT